MSCPHCGRMKLTDDELRYLVHAIGMEPFGSDTVDPDELGDRIEAELDRRQPHEHRQPPANPTKGDTNG